ncbi:hypothetical protein QJS04_geneDACA023188 [Acorus gramineus]|uniref:Uncharacterized protein n=1 Tax=Acorus gramineus TaxID=55184 RepID=A0AAV9BWN7_ACOGR|nr:hypothetical protein QJS04_geneDACA023188 [Acorus gramineus]
MAEPTRRQNRLRLRNWMNLAPAPTNPLRPPAVPPQTITAPSRQRPLPPLPPTSSQKESPPQADQPSSTEQTTQISSSQPQPSPSPTPQQPSPNAETSQPQQTDDTPPSLNAASQPQEGQQQPLPWMGSNASTSRPDSHPPSSRTPSPKLQSIIEITSRSNSPLNVASQQQPATKNDAIAPSPTKETEVPSSTAPQPQIEEPSETTNQPSPEPQVKSISPQSEPTNQLTPPPQITPPHSEEASSEMLSQPKPENREGSLTQNEIPNKPTPQQTDMETQPEDSVTPTSGYHTGTSIPENPQEIQATESEDKQDPKHEAVQDKQTMTKEVEGKKQVMDTTPPDTKSDSRVEQGFLNSDEAEMEMRRRKPREPDMLTVNNDKEATRYRSNGKERKVEIGTTRGASPFHVERNTMQKDIKENTLKYVQDITSNKSKHPMTDYKVSIITLAGENIGASMHIGSEAGKGDSIIHVHRGDKLNEDNKDEATRNKEKPTHKNNAAPAIMAGINNNVQSINNSIMHNSSCNEKNSGVHMVLSSKSTEPVKLKGRKELMDTHKDDFNRAPRKFGPESMVRRRCLRALFNKSSESDPENPHKPRRHGYRFNPAEKKKNRFEPGEPSVKNGINGHAEETAYGKQVSTGLI